MNSGLGLQYLDLQNDQAPVREKMVHVFHQTGTEEEAEDQGQMTSVSQTWKLARLVLLGIQNLKMA